MGRTNGRNPILREDREANSPAKPEGAETHHATTVTATRESVNNRANIMQLYLDLTGACRMLLGQEAEKTMVKEARVVLLVGAVLLLAGCASDGPAPYDYNPDYNHSIDSDISATHDGGAATIDNRGPRGGENWRLGDPRPVAR